ncbi:hypothetical protein TB2_006788 [Malus domestica]
MAEMRRKKIGCGDRSWWRQEYQSSWNSFANLTDADYRGVELDVAETAKLGSSSNDVLGVVEVELPCYVRESVNLSAHPLSEAFFGMAVMGLDDGLDPRLGLGRVMDFGKIVGSCLEFDSGPIKGFVLIAASTGFRTDSIHFGLGTALKVEKDPTLIFYFIIIIFFCTKKL